MAYSTIRQKTGVCEICDDGKQVSLTKKLCSNHYWQGIRMKSVIKQSSKEPIDDEDVATLKIELDGIFSKWVRLSASDENGIVSCFICGNKVRWQDAQNMHYVKRGNSFLRYDPRNCKAGDKECNEYKNGNYLEYTKQLERNANGVTDILLEEANIVYKFTRHELKQLINHYSELVSKLLVIKGK